MFRTCTKVLVVLALAVMLVVVAPAQSEAFGHHRGCGGCGWGWGSGWGCGWSCCTPCCSWTPCCWWPCYTSCFDGCCGAGIGTVVVGGDCCGAVAAPAVVVPGAGPAIVPGAPAPTLAPPPVPGVKPAPGATPPTLPSDPTPLPRTSTLDRSESGLLTVAVPEDAKVYVNGYLTKSTGANRQYVSHGLKAGLTYTYEIRAELVRDGQTLKQTRMATLRAGTKSAVAMDFNVKSADGLAVNW